MLSFKVVLWYAIVRVPRRGWDVDVDVDASCEVRADRRQTAAFVLQDKVASIEGEGRSN